MSTQIRGRRARHGRCRTVPSSASCFQRVQQLRTSERAASRPPTTSSVPLLQWIIVRRCTTPSSRGTQPHQLPHHSTSPSAPSHISNNSSPNLIDSLFQNLSPPAPAEQHQSPAAPTAIPESHPPESYVPENYHDQSAAASVMSLPEDTAISPNTIAERQNSLLSLIGAPATNRPSQAVVQPQQPVQTQPQQVPTPPGSSQRSNASPPQSEAQKMLDQMLGG